MLIVYKLPTEDKVGGAELEKKGRLIQIVKMLSTGDKINIINRELFCCTLFKTKHRNVFQNDVNTLSKIVNHFFVKRHKILHRSNHTILFKFHKHVVRYQIMYGETLDFQCQHQQW